MWARCHSTAQHSTAQHSTAQHSTAQFNCVNPLKKVKHFFEKFLNFHKLNCFVCIILFLTSVHAIAKDETITFRDGSRYVGEVVDDKPHGKGTITWRNGSKYVGEFLDGKPHGTGIFTWRDGAKYEGEVLDDKPHGTGTYTWKDGSKYEGQWESGIKQGTGTYTWITGSKYEGEWRGDKANGKGTMAWADGRRYDGEWEDDKMHGRGRMTHPYGRVQDGLWIHSEFQEVKVEPKVKIPPNIDFSAWGGFPVSIYSSESTTLKFGRYQFGVKGNYNIAFSQSFGVGLGAFFHYTNIKVSGTDLENNAITSIKRMATGADIALFYIIPSMIRPYLRVTYSFYDNFNHNAPEVHSVREGDFLPFEIGLGVKYDISKIKLFAELMFDFQGNRVQRLVEATGLGVMDMALPISINVGITYIPIIF